MLQRKPHPYDATTRIYPAVGGLSAVETYANFMIEFFDSDVERTTVASIMENQGLLQENKQLNALMTEYEQTLETVMTKFRQHAVCDPFYDKLFS